MEKDEIDTPFTHTRIDPVHKGPEGDRRMSPDKCFVTFGGNLKTKDLTPTRLGVSTKYADRFLRVSFVIFTNAVLGESTRHADVFEHKLRLEGRTAGQNAFPHGTRHKARRNEPKYRSFFPPFVDLLVGVYRRIRRPGQKGFHLPIGAGRLRGRARFFLKHLDAFADMPRQIAPHALKRDPRLNA